MYVDPYIKNVIRIFPEQGRYGYHRYDMNENPEGLPEDFVQSVLKEITPEFLAIYPEPDAFLQKYAQFVGVDFENVLATNGSDMAIRYVLETFGEQGKKVVTVSPSFEMYAVNCWILGLQHTPVAYESDLSIDVSKICAAIDNDTRIVVLLNPNNPVGNVYSEEEAERVISRAKEVGAVVVIDEAYHYFYDKTFLNLALKYDNVIVLRTFSKLFSLAACRLGVVISSPQLIDYIKKCKLTFDVNAVALKFGERIIENRALIDSLIQSEREGKAYLLGVLKAESYECIDCRGNYVLIKTKRNPKETEKILKERDKILVHTFSNPLLEKYMRVSVGSQSAMQFFVNAFLNADK